VRGGLEDGGCRSDVTGMSTNPVTLGGPADDRAAALRAAVADVEQAARDVDVHGDVARLTLPAVVISRHVDGTWRANITTKVTVRQRLNERRFALKLKAVGGVVASFMFITQALAGVFIVDVVFRTVLAAVVCVLFVAFVEHVPTRVTVETVSFAPPDRGVVVLDQLTWIASRFAEAGASSATKSILGLRDRWAVAMCTARRLHELGRVAHPALAELHARMTVTADTVARMYLDVFPIPVADRVEAGRHNDMVRGVGNILDEVEATLVAQRWVGNIER
jgi:hypothetical protein